MAVDTRILERFQAEFQASKQREADAQNALDQAQSAVDLWTAKIADESGIQQALNAALVQLGEAPLS